MRSRILTVVALVVLSSLVGYAQDGKVTSAPVPGVVTAPKVEAPKPAPEPTVSDVTALTLDKMIAEMDKRQLTIRAAQAEIALAQNELERIKADAQAYAMMQQKSGYTLAKNQGGKWIYVKQEPPKPTPEPEKK